MNEHNVRVAFDGRIFCVLFIRRHTLKNFVHAQKSLMYCANNNVCQRTATNLKRTQTDELTNFNVYQRMSPMQNVFIQEAYAELIRYSVNATLGECQTLDRKVAGSILTRGAVLCP